MKSMLLINQIEWTGLLIALAIMLAIYALGKQGKMFEAVRKVIYNLRGEILLLTFLAAFLSALSCEGQVRVNGNLKDRPDGTTGIEFNLGQAKKTIDSLKAVVSDLGKTLNDREQAIFDLNSEITQLNSQITGLRAELTTASASLVETQNLLNQKEQELSEKVSQNEQLALEVAELSEQIAAKNSRINALNKKITEHEAAIVQKDEEIQNLKDQLAQGPDVIRDTIVVEKEVIVHDTIIETVYDTIIDIQFPEPHIDTITTISDPILLDFTDSLVKPVDTPAVYVMVMGIGLVRLHEMDTIYRFQKIYNIERTFDYSERRDAPVTYKNVGLPFQFRNVWVENQTIMQPPELSQKTIYISVTEPLGELTVTLKGKNYKQFDNPSFEKISEIEYHAFFRVDYPADGTQWIQIIARNPEGHLDVYDLKL